MEFKSIISRSFKWEKRLGNFLLFSFLFAASYLLIFSLQFYNRTGNHQTVSHRLNWFAANQTLVIIISLILAFLVFYFYFYSKENHKLIATLKFDDSRKLLIVKLVDSELFQEYKYDKIRFIIFTVNNNGKISNSEIHIWKGRHQIGVIEKINSIGMDESEIFESILSKINSDFKKIKIVNKLVK